MGVLGLWKLLEDGGKPVPLDTLENKVLAIDISIWLHQTVKGIQDGRGKALPNAHLTGLFIRLCKLLHYRIKPVFVFDGGVPALKRQTINKRSQTKNRIESEASRIEQLLLEGLAREQVVQQMLGNKVKDILSPSKSRAVRRRDDEKDEMFKLPQSEPLTTIEEVEDDDSDDELKEFYMSRMQDIDVKSSHFQSIPADIRHSILYEMKEARKLSSWGRLQEFPTHSDNFSGFQMKRLLKRRQVQVSLEQAESEMGGKSMTFHELESLMSEEGIIDPVQVTKKGKQLASDENTHFLLVKGLATAVEEAKKVEAVETNQVAEPNQNGEDYDLQMAIAMSLEDDPSNLTQADVKSTKEIRLNTPQREMLKMGAKASAKEYMQEYGVLTTEEISDLFVQKSLSPEGPKSRKKLIEEDDEESDDEPEPLPVTQSLNCSQKSDASTIIYEVEQKAAPEKEGEPQNEADILSVTSSTDSDFVDVPEDNISQTLIASIDPYPLPQADPKREVRVEDVKKLEVIIDPNQGDDDLFADVFKKEPSPIPVTKKVEPEIIVLDESINNPAPSKAKKAADILEELKAQKEALLNLDQSNILDLVELESEPEEPSVDLVSSKKFVDATKLLRSPSVTPTKKKVGKVQNTTPEKKLEEAILSAPGTSSENLEQIKEKVMKDAGRLEELATIASDVAIENQLLLEEMNKKDRHGLSITERMTSECQTLLKLFGVPFIVAPMEAEAQCAFLNEIGLIDGIITDDSDVWLFGGKTVYKNFFDKEKVVMEFRFETIERLYHIDRSKMIQLALLVGSDYTSGIPGVGTVTALEILAAFPTTKVDTGTDQMMSILSCLRKFRDWVENGKNPYSKETTVLKPKLKSVKEIVEGFPNRAVVEAYLHPSVDASDENFTWGMPDEVSIKVFAKRSMGWTEKRVDDYLLPVLKRLDERQVQQSIRNYFNVNAVHSHKELAVSKRVKNAITRLGGEEVEEDEKPTKKQKTPKKKEIDDLVGTADTEKAEKDEPKKRATRKAKEPKEPRLKKTTDIEKRTTRKRKSPEKEASTVPKMARIPNTKAPIPQRVQDQEKAKEDKKKAIELFKARKQSK